MEFKPLKIGASISKDWISFDSDVNDFREQSALLNEKYYHLSECFDNP